MIKPALTPEEWAKLEAFTDRWRHVARLAEWLETSNAPSLFKEVAKKAVTDPHTRAALSLLGQPFGFTHADVKLLRDTALGYESGDFVSQKYGIEIGAQHRELADRLAALLPPQTP
jgi:hypothetical protein